MALFSPASSPGVASSSWALKPRASAQRRYMRSSISAQSWLSVPPAPACTPTTAGPESYSPVKSASSWSFSHVAVEARQRALELAAPVGVLGGHLEHRVELGRLGAQALVGVELGLRAVQLGRGARGPALVVPEALCEGLALELRPARLECIRVKGNHGPSAAGPSTPRPRRADRRATAAPCSRRYAPWHRLNFLPEPHQHGSLRPTVALGVELALLDDREAVRLGLVVDVGRAWRRRRAPRASAASAWR